MAFRNLSLATNHDEILELDMDSFSSLTNGLKGASFDGALCIVNESLMWKWKCSCCNDQNGLLTANLNRTAGVMQRKYKLCAF